jgi:CHAP domain
MKLDMWRRAALFGTAVPVLVFGAFAGPGAPAMAGSVSFTHGEGSGPAWCGSYGGTNQASFDNVYACSPNNASAGATPFDEYPGFQCVELANRFLWDVYSDGPIFGINGWNFAQTVHADYPAVPLDPNGAAGDPYLPGDIVSFTGNPGTPVAGVGHVAVVTASTENSSGNGSVTVLQENATPYLQTLTVSNWSLHMPSGSWVTPYQFDAFTSSPPPAAPPVIAVRTPAGDVSAKQGSLSAQWVDEAGPKVTGVAVASDPVHGPLIAIRESNGEVYAKEGGLSAQWVDESSGVASVAVATDASNGPLIVIRKSNGEVYAKQGSLSAQWVDEAGPNVTAVAVASDPVHGPLIAIRESNGEVYAKDGGLSAQWVDEAGPSATAVAVASDPEYGSLIAVRYSGGGVYAKEGGLSAQWVDEAGGDSGVAVAG